MSFLSKILDSLFPDTCLGCGKEASLLCDNCLDATPRIHGACSPDTYSLFHYKSPLIQKALWHLKYRQKKRIAERLAPLLQEELIQEISNEAEWNPGAQILWLVFPVPASKKRTRGRGYNQAAELARHIAAASPQYLEYAPHLLIKHRETPSQVSMKNKSERVKNIAGSFSLTEPHRVKDRWCIVIDDITTTGATLDESRRVLLEAGAARVLAFTIAS